MRYNIFLIAIFFSLYTLAQNRTVNRAKEDFAQGKYAEGLVRLSALSKDANEQVLFQFVKASYFSFTNNPKHELDSAYVCIELSEKMFATLSEKDRNNVCADFAICGPRFLELKDSLTKEIFSELSLKNDLSALQIFCIKYSKASVYEQAVQKVEDLKFEQAEKANDIILFDQFLKTYPQSKYSSQIKDLREKLRYEIAVNTNSIKVYQEFLAEFNSSKWKFDVQNRIELIEYNRVKKSNTLLDYQGFITEFPSGKYQEEISKIVYNLRLEGLQQQGDIRTIEAFLSDYPLQQNPELTIRLEEMYYNQAIQSNTKVDWIEFIKKFPSSSHYAEAETALSTFFTIMPFLNGNGRMEFRDIQTNIKQFNTSFDFVMPFEHNRAIVSENGRYGLIDDQGKFLFSMIYDGIQSYFNGDLIVAENIKNNLLDYWQKSSNDIYNQDWSTDDIEALKSHLQSVNYFGDNSVQSNVAYRRYLGALISNQYYSFSNFSYNVNSSEYNEIKIKAENEFNQKDYYLYLFGPGPFMNKKVVGYRVYEYWDDYPGFEYELNNQTYFVEYQNGKFVDVGSVDHLITYKSNELRIVRYGWVETEETYNPGTFYLESNDGRRITKQDFNILLPIGEKGEYFLCHIGGTYEPYKGSLWDIVGGKYGVLNKNGQVILPFIFDDLTPVDSFDVNPYFVSTINKVLPTEFNNYKETLGDVGVLDINGKEIIPYSDGYNVISFQNANCILVTKNAVIGYYANGMTDGSITLGGLHGVIDLNRKVILPIEYNEINSISNDQIFVVRKGMKLLASKEYPDEYTEIGGKYTLVDRKNQPLIPIPVDYLSTDLVACNGCTVSYYGSAFNGKWGVISETGKTIIPFNYSYIEATNDPKMFMINIGRTYKKEEYGFETNSQGKSGLMKNGALMLPVKYDDISIYDSYILAETGTIKEYLQLNYQPIPFKCDEITSIGGQDDVKNMLYAFRVGPKWGLMNRNNEKITEANFWGQINEQNNSHPFSVEKGLILVNEGGLKYYVTRKGLVLKE
ncbi:MAG: hypothetical protein RLZZ585_1717 [Bacteroidota bacterium]|jgi:hypothetical protein